MMITTKQQSKNVSRSDSKEFCIDPSLFLEQSLDKGKSSILFLLVFHHSLIIRKHWGTKVCLQTAESFPRRKPASFHRKLPRDDLSKREHSLAKLVETIHALLMERSGIISFFFPSYQYLDLAVEAFRQQYPDSNVLIQETDMNEEERERF